MLIHLLKEPECDVKLSPIGEDSPIGAVGDELLGELSDPRVQVIQDHVGHRPSLHCPPRDQVQGQGLQGHSRQVVKRIDVTVLIELFSEDVCELGMQVF